MSEKYGNYTIYNGIGCYEGVSELSYQFYYIEPLEVVHAEIYDYPYPMVIKKKAVEAEIDNVVEGIEYREYAKRLMNPLIDYIKKTANQECVALAVNIIDFELI